MILKAEFKPDSTIEQRLDIINKLRGNGNPRIDLVTSLTKEGYPPLSFKEGPGKADLLFADGVQIEFEPLDSDPHTGRYYKAQLYPKVQKRGEWVAGNQSEWFYVSIEATSEEAAAVRIENRLFGTTWHIVPGTVQEITPEEAMKIDKAEQEKKDLDKPVAI